MRVQKLSVCSCLVVVSMSALSLVAAPGSGAAGSPTVAVPPQSQTDLSMERKLQVVLPQMAISEAPLRSVMDFLGESYASQRKRDGATNDTLNIVLDHSVTDPGPAITIHLNNVSYGDALKLCCAVAGVEFVVEKNAVVIRRPPEKAAVGAYLVDTRITPTEGTNTYLAEFRIRRGNKDGSSTDLSRPKMTVVLGNEGRMEIADDEGKTGLFCTVLVKEEEKGGISASTHVTIREGGKIVSDTAQSISVPVRQTDAARPQGRP